MSMLPIKIVLDDLLPEPRSGRSDAAAAVAQQPRVLSRGEQGAFDIAREVRIHLETVEKLSES